MVEGLNRKFQPLEKSDSRGNVLRVDFAVAEGKATGAAITLFLAGQKRPRSIGVVTKDGVFHVKRSRSQHLHRKSKSYGFNDDVLREALVFHVERIRISEDGGAAVYEFPRSVIDERGFYLHFKDKGFELQRFLSLAFIEPFKIEKNEKTQID